MFTAIIVSGALGALGGMIGFGLANFLSRISGSDDIPRWPAVIGVALALTLAHPVNQWINRPPPDSVLQDLEQKEPFYTAIRENHPDVYAKIRQVISESIESGNVVLAKSKIRSIVLPLIARKLPNASDDNLFVFASLIRDQAMALADDHPEACVALLKGEPFDFQAVMPPGLITRENGLYRRLFSDQSKGGKIASEAQVATYLRVLIQNVRRDLNVSSEQVVAALNFEGPADLQCRASASFFDAFTKSWSQDGGPEVLRAILKDRPSS